MGTFTLEKEENNDNNKNFNIEKKNLNDLDINIDIDLNNNYIDKIKNTNLKVVSIMNLIKGAFAGIEIAFGNEYYNYSLKATGSINVVFKININFLPELNNEIIDFLRPLFLKQKEILGNLMIKNKNIKTKINNLFNKSNKQKSRLRPKSYKLKESNHNYNYKNDYVNNYEDFIGNDLKQNLIKKEYQKNLVKSSNNKFSKRYLSFDIKGDSYSNNVNNVSSIRNDYLLSQENEEKKNL